VEVHVVDVHPVHGCFGGGQPDANTAKARARTA
jgi:hypothetical protein